jgi:hypothetical protein
VAKFLRIGIHNSNVGGYTSKAWTIRRIGSTVLLKWGAVEVWSGSWQTDLLGASAATKNYSLWFGEASARLCEKSDCSAARTSI